MLTWSVRDLARSVATLMINKGQEFDGLARVMKKVAAKYLYEKGEGLRHIEKHVTSMDPVNILKRGFSITMHNGKILKSYTSVNEGDIVTTVLVDGTIDSKVSKSVKSE